MTSSIVSESGALAPHILRRITLAAEHIASLVLVLQIAREFNQPISSAVLHNLMLVEKDLCILQRELEEQLIQRCS